ncbi:MAG TPA: glycosyltransferase family 4 protein [Bryobacteraceae bacterium]|nr:glycosyltransferase family 4 protein [Bryobacteraceae bacterium]
MTRRLLVIINDRLSELVRKGEITPRYYNPGEVFDEVHILMTNDDRPDPEALQETAGKAALFLHNLPGGRSLFLKSLGWRPWLLRHWANGAVRLAEQIRPAFVRCHGNHLNAFAAREIKRRLGIPYVVSLHINADQDLRGRASDGREWLISHAPLSMERINLSAAELAMPVYEPILPYLQRMQARNVQVLYNVLNGDHLRHKIDYRLHDPIRIVSVGRQFREKDPTHLLEAVAELGNVTLTLVGNGPLHSQLRDTARRLGMGDRVEFQTAIPNRTLCESLADYDLFAVHSEYAEISKAVLEALLVGLPVVINRRWGQPVPELDDGIVRTVENSKLGYLNALRNLINDDLAREALGRKAFSQAQQRYAPSRTEAEYAKVYQRLLDESIRAGRMTAEASGAHG